jgi:hypothetical protein
MLSLGITPKRFAPLGSSNDADAQAFITAAGITDATQQSAVNQLVLDLKSANIWTKMKAIYPIVGGTASTHKWNLKDPRDLDAAYRLTFATGWTHSSIGMLPNGTSAYADTFFIPATNGLLNSSHISFYSRTNNTTVANDFGANNSLGTAGATQMYIYIAGQYRGISDSLASIVSDYVLFTNSNTTGFYINTRTASNAQAVYKNGTIQNSNTKTGNRTSLKLLIGAQNKDNPNGVIDYSNRQCAFASIGDGLTGVEALAFYTSVQTFQTTLGRNV